jgi:hypothetical protein
MTLKLRYIGRAFRERHGVGLRELGRGAGIRAATLVALEHGRSPIDTDDLGRIIDYFRARDIACRLEDLVVEVEEEEADERRDGDTE